MNIEKFVKEKYEVELPDDLIFLEYGDKIRVARKDVVNFLKRNNILDRNFHNFILFARVGKKIKLTTNAMQIFLRNAKKNVAIIKGKKVKEYVSGVDVIPDEMINCEEGYIVVKSENDVLGCGLLMSGNRIKNQIPKSRRIK